jgi:hypothetical protein
MLIMMMMMPFEKRKKKVLKCRIANMNSIHPSLLFNERWKKLFMNEWDKEQGLF